MVVMLVALMMVMLVALVMVMMVVMAVPKGPIHHETALFQVMDRHLFSAKPSEEPMMCFDTIVWHWTTIS